MKLEKRPQGLFFVWNPAGNFRKAHFNGHDSDTIESEEKGCI